MDIDAIIPARGGSKRIPGKNMKELAGKPLIWWTIKAAQEAGIFKRIVVSTEDAFIKDYCRGVVEVIDRPQEYATDISPDIEWIRHYLDNHEHSEYFMILRPTSPFRTAETIKGAWGVYRMGNWLKAVEPVKQHPNKMWLLSDSKEQMRPIGPDKNHSLPTQSIYPVYAQNGCIEIRPATNPEPLFYQPFLTLGFEGLDLNTPEDWILAEHYLKEGVVTL